MLFSFALNTRPIHSCAYLNVQSNKVSIQVSTFYLRRGSVVVDKSRGTPAKTESAIFTCNLTSPQQTIRAD